MTAVIPNAWTVGAVVVMLGCAPGVRSIGTSRAADTGSPVKKAAQSRQAVRSESQAITALVANAIGQSPTLARLIHDIGLTDGIVYILPGRCPVPGLRGCLLHLLGHAHSARYLWIRVHPVADPLDLTTTIAHELQHALEVLRQPSIRTTWDLVQFYRAPDTRAFAAGPQGTFQSYETAAAISVGAIVRSELTAFVAAAAAAELVEEAPIPP